MGGVGSIIAFLIGGKLYKINQAYPFGWQRSWCWWGVFGVPLIREPKIYEENPILKSPICGESEADLRGTSAQRHPHLLAIFFWFVAMNAMKPSRFCQPFVGMAEGDAVSLLTLNSLAFVLMALPAGISAARPGANRRSARGWWW